MTDIIKVNLGCGLKYMDGWINVDSDTGVKTDVCLDIEREPLPFGDSTVSEVKAHHILEHVGNGFLRLMQELYRVCRHDALLDILVPHHQHDNFYGDPTHKRPITVSGMYLFSKEHCREHAAAYGSSRGLAVQLDIDFRMEHYEFEFDPFYKTYLDRVEEARRAQRMTADEVMAYKRLMREGCNVALHTIIKMRCVKLS